MLTTLLALAMTVSTDPLNTEFLPRPAAAEALRQAVDTSHVMRASGGSGLAQLVSGGRSASNLLDGSPLGATLEELVEEGRWRAVIEPEAAADWLESELSGVLDDLLFEPVMEADLPVGFPAPTPVREIELKQYPAYRSASAEVGGSGSGTAFWKLFLHIKANDISMTAPVEMSYEDRDGELRETSMAFLYGDPELGKVGAAGMVVVADEKSNWFVSMGCRGTESEARIAEAHSQLLEWIVARPDLQVSGALRVMGYNSPMVRGNRRYFEVQVPVVRTDLEVVDFGDAEGLESWRPVNDSVMGGRSASRIWTTEGGLGLFIGNLSLENNGGFASVRSGPLDGRLQGAEQLVMRFRGDGKTYKLRLRTASAGESISFQAPFETVAGEWSERVFSVSDFTPVRRGRLVPSAPALELSDVTDLGIIISDKQAGPFRLELSTIEKR